MKPPVDPVRYILVVCAEEEFWAVYEWDDNTASLEAHAQKLLADAAIQYAYILDTAPSTVVWEGGEEVKA